jgi:serine/threonine-protein kinase
VLQETGRSKQAEPVYRDALAIQKQLAADFPNRPDFRSELAKSHNNLAIVLGETGRPQEAETAFRDAIAIDKELATSFPAIPDYQADLANALDDLAELTHDQHHDIEACRLLDQAQPAIQAALRANPRHPFYHAIAGENRRILSLARLGLGKHAAAAAAAEEMLTIGPNPATDAYTAAGLLAQCVLLAEKDSKVLESKRKELAQGYADRAMAALRLAIAKGLKDLAKMKKDKDLDSLRSRDDFKKLLADLEKSAPPDKKAK